MAKREYPDRPVVGVGVAVVGPNGILLIKRGQPPHQGSWSLPGGAQELGETAVECGRREVLEETGLVISQPELVDVVNSIQYDKINKIQYHYTLIDFVATVASGSLAAGSDADDARWFERAEIDDLELWSETSRIITLALEKHDTLNVL